MNYRHKRILSQSLIGVLGRRNSARLARFMLNEARLDLPNSPELNGERLVQHCVVAAALARGKRMVAFDVGANIGDWSLALLAAARRHPDLALRLYAFEPISSTFQMLNERLTGRPHDRATFVPVPRALSDRDGSGVFFIPAPGAGTSSLYETSSYDRVDEDAVTHENVTLATLDSYCTEQEIEFIDVLKVDAEGHDCAVLQGARAMLSSQRIGVVQFEYNWRWVMARRFLKDTFDLLLPLHYVLGKVTRHGIELYKRWSPELETFVEGNYLAVSPDWISRFPHVRWWNDK